MVYYLFISFDKISRRGPEVGGEFAGSSEAIAAASEMTSGTTTAAQQPQNRHWSALPAAAQENIAARKLNYYLLVEK